MNGNTTKNENMADLGGIKIAYKAYKHWHEKKFQNSLDDIEEPRIPGFEKYSNDQMFWISFARTFCEHQDRDSLKDAIMNDTHTINEFRIIGSFSNLPEFSDDFSCSSYSNMKPTKKCTIW